MISPESQGGPNIGLITIACGWTFAGVAILGVSLLVWARRINKKGLGLEDYSTILALVITIALMAQTTWAIVVEGQDDHEAEVSSTKFAMVVRSLLVSQTLWGLINTLIRMNALLFVGRIFADIRKMKLIARSLLVLSILYGLVVFLEVFLICRPMAVDWDAHVDGTCGDQIVSYLVLEILGLLIDFTILVAPLPIIWRLWLPWPRRIPIAAVFSIGVLVFIVTGLRIQALHMANAEDFTYSKGYLGLLSALGASLGITFCCATAVPVVYRQWRAAFLKHASKTTHVNEPSLPMTEDHPTQTHGRSKRWGIAVKLIQRYQQTKAFPESVSGADHIDEETPAAASESPDISLPMTVDDATQTHCRSEPRDVYVTITYDTSKALLERVPRAVSTDDSNPAAAAKNPDEILLPTTEDKANETPGRIARRSIDGCAAGAKPPPCGGLQRHRTF